MRTISFTEATLEAMQEEMRRDATVFLMGEDIAKQGGIFGQFRGLPQEFGFDRVRDTTISDPIFGYNPLTEMEEEPFQPQVIDVMAVSNLPNELPRESSAEFGDKLIEFVVEELFDEKSEIIERATIAKKGKLTKRFDYLSDYVS